MRVGNCKLQVVQKEQILESAGGDEVKINNSGKTGRKEIQVNHEKEVMMASDKSKKEIWDEWKKFVNMPPSELEKWLKSEKSKAVGDASDSNKESTGHKSGRHILKIKRTKKADLTEGQWDHMATVIGYIKRHCSQGGPKKNPEDSKWRYSLMNWGHDPFKKGGCG